MAKATKTLRQRAKYLNQLKHKFMNFYTEARDNVIKNDIWKLAERNQTLLGCSTPSFVYNQVFYINGPQPRYGSDEYKKANKILSPELYEEVDLVLNGREFKDRVEEAAISSLINNALIEAQHVMDLNGMLKSMTSSFVIDEEIFNIGSPMADSKIKEFTQNNKEGIKCLNEIAIRALLLKRM